LMRSANLQFACFQWRSRLSTSRQRLYARAPIRRQRLSTRKKPGHAGMSHLVIHRPVRVAGLCRSAKCRRRERTCQRRKPGVIGNRTLNRGARGSRDNACRCSDTFRHNSSHAATNVLAQRG